jgi:gliding motility-associated-like protein
VFGGFVGPARDSDGDGIPNYLDEDSDDDTVSDADENDPDGDNFGPDDTDGDGLPDFIDIDDDNDGELTADEWDFDGNGIGPDDCDEDGLWDYLDTDLCSVILPEGFSPNNDGVNDVWNARGLDRFPNHTLVIFNRWGNKVFEAAPYKSDWGGENVFGLSIGNELPDGTYYYIIEYNDGITPPTKGWVYIKR